MKNITIKDLRAIPPYKVFVTGEALALRWVAQKLPNHYWTIYFGGFFTPDYGIVAKGKVLPLAIAKSVISCNKEVWERYKKGGEKN
jgi:hypothetical protein